MTRSEFLNEIIKKCEFDGSVVNENTELDSMEDWDSLNFLAIISLFKITFDFTPNIEQMRNCKTMGEILDIAESKYEK